MILFLESASVSSDGPKERGKRQKHPLTSTDDELQPYEYEEQLEDELKAVTYGKPDHYLEYKKREEEHKKLYLSETGRTITLDLLKKGVNPGPGKILHIEPGPDDEVEEPTNEDLFSINQDITETKLNRDDKADRGGNNNGNDKFDQEITDPDDLPDDDPEFQEFMKAFKSSMGENNFDEMLDALGKRVDKQSEENNVISDPNVKGRDNLLSEFDELDDEEGEDDELTQRAKESIADVEKGLIDFETMTPGRVSTLRTKSFDEELNNLKEMKSKKVEEKLLKKEKEYQSKLSSTSESSFDFDSVDLGNPEHLKPSNLVKRKEKNSLLSLLDNEVTPEEFLQKTQASSTTSPDSQYLSSQKVTKYSVGEDGAIPSEEVDRQWNYILFARCPEPDYSKPLPERRQEHIIRANALYQDMIDHNLEPNVDTMNSYLSVFTEASKLDDALNLLDKFASQHDLVPNETTYYQLIRMHIYLKDIEGARARFNEMKERDIIPSGKTYGSLIQSYCHRDRLVDALQLLEEAHDQKIHISNTYIKKLRNRCETLGLSHPYIPPDPDQWIKDVQEVRRKSKGKPIGAKVHLAQGLSYH